MNEAKQDWRWLPQWAPTFAVLVACWVPWFQHPSISAANSPAWIRGSPN